MKKLILLLAAVCYTAMMQAEIVYNVPYIDENGVEQICEKATVVTNSGPFTWTDGWYVLGSDIYVKDIRNIVCQGDVRFIISDGNSMKTQGEDWHAGIQVQGEGNSLTIYGQKDQAGKLIARGGQYGAGIGGSGQDGIGNNITINSGVVEAYAGEHAAAIGGAMGGYGSNITINGGLVFATGYSSFSSAIGSEINGKPASNIFVADKLKIMMNISSDINKYAKDRNLFEHSSIEDDVANEIAGNRYFASVDFTLFFANIDKFVVNYFGDEQNEIFLRFVNSVKQQMVESPLILTYSETTAARDLAKVKIRAAKELLQYLPNDENIRQEEYIDSIFSTIASVEQDFLNSLDVEGIVKTKKTEAIGHLKGFTAGFGAGNTSALGPLGPKQNGPALIVTDKDDKEIILYSPKSVEYIKVKEE